MTCSNSDRCAIRLPIRIFRNAIGFLDWSPSWHDKTNKTEVWVYNIGTGGYTWPSATNTHETLDITFVVPAPPKPADQAAFVLWVTNRSGLTAAQLLVQEMTYI